MEQTKIPFQDALNALENDINKAISRSKNKTVSALLTKKFNDRLSQIQNIHEQTTSRYILSMDKNLELIDEIIKKSRKRYKKAVFWSVSVLFIFLAKIEFSAVNKLNTGSFFGIEISGIEKHEVILGLWVYLTYLLFSGSWYNYKASTLLTNENKKLLGVLKKTHSRIERISEFIELNSSNKKIISEDKHFENSANKLIKKLNLSYLYFVRFEKNVIFGLSLVFSTFACIITYKFIIEGYDLKISPHYFTALILTVFITFLQIPEAFKYFIKWKVRDSSLSNDGDD